VNVSHILSFSKPSEIQLITFCVFHQCDPLSSCLVD
jgi:hypothetical protein